MKLPAILALYAACIRFAFASPTQHVLSAPSEEFAIEKENSSFIPPADWTFPYAPGSIKPVSCQPILKSVRLTYILLYLQWDQSTATFLEYLYKGEPTDHKPWISNTDGRDPDEFPWMNQRIGDATLKPSENEKEWAADKRNPNWRWSESWRIITLYNQLINTRAAKPAGNGRVISEYFSTLGNSKLAGALFPSDVKILLENNERAIVNSETSWVGNLTSRAPYKPFDGVRVTTSRDALYAQKGPVGPMSLEASFILATQLAGINWKTLRTNLNNDALITGVYWVSGIIPDTSLDELIYERRGKKNTRTLGYLSRRGAPTDGSPDAGFYIMLDIDPQVNGHVDHNKNVFVYASHVMDQHSRMLLEDQGKLHKMAYVGDYDPADSDKIVKKIDPKKDEKTKGQGVRFYAHGHAAVLPFHEFMKWLGQTIPNKGNGEAMPRYNQIGDMHLYYLPEDEDSIWPREEYLRQLNNVV
ncbi:hypothetical protein BC629DRAFT_589661 [Irpex lacteus]|nr:hypothetical protein BC629DRAFT_589661 [Irpex lacteus]